LPYVLRRIDPRIAVATGSDHLVKDFGESNKILREAGEFGANGRHFLSRRELARAIRRF